MTFRYKKIGFSGVIEAVTNMDMEVFPDASAIRSLQTFIPTEDEIASINEWVNQEDSDPATQMKLMGTAEQFCYDYVVVPQLKQRLEVFQFVLEFFPKQSEMGPQIATLLKCAKYVVSEKKIQKFLEIVIHVGNFLNAGNKRLGACTAFEFETFAVLHGNFFFSSFSLFSFFDFFICNAIF